ncbi:MAG TPA: ABC transporter substrate-binding protein, partial [Dehalococcoidia bacterium]|nr:ABC transporter substrate-binding protein [Dehalococcoidia bacterium]
MRQHRDAESYSGKSTSRRLTRRHLLATSSLAAAGLAVAACGRTAGNTPKQAASSAGKGAPKPGGQIRLRLTEDPIDWDVSLLGKGGADGIFFAYDNLVGFKAGSDVGYTDAVLAPELAESWEIQDEGRTFIFHLRKGVKFANLPPVNGREFTAADVKWSYEYWTRTGDFAAKKLPTGQWAWMFEGLDRVEAPDPYTAVARFKKPFVPFVSYTAAERGSPIVPHEIYDADGNLSNRLAGTGAFQMDVSASQKGSRWVWKKNPSYWESGKPYIDEIRQLIVPDDASAAAAFRTKQLDVLGDVGNGWNLSYEDGERIKQENPAAGVVDSMHPKPLLLYINVQREPFKDLRVRQALSLALDR